MNKQPVERFEAVIVGAGMVGTALAGLLSRAGMQVALVEAKPDPVTSVEQTAVPEPRVSALTPVSQRLLTHLDAWPAMAAMRVTPYRYMQVWDGQGSGHIHFAADQAGTAVLGHIVENGVTLAALNQQVLKQPTLTALHGVKLTALHTSQTGRWLVLEDGRQLETPLLVAADGARSLLRELAGIDVNEESMAQEAVVTTVRCEKRHGATARQVFTESGPLAFLPLSVAGDERYCSIVWSTSPEHAARLEAMTGEALGEALADGFAHRLGAVTAVDSAYRFPLVQRHAKRYVEPHLALVGDAAHSIHPLAGQGVNLGFMDAAVLAEEVTRAWRRGVPWGELTTLSRYERRRRFDNASMLALMKGFKEVFGSRLPLVTLGRNLGLSGVNQWLPLKRTLMRQATGERGRLPLSCR